MKNEKKIYHPILTTTARKKTKSNVIVNKGHGKVSLSVMEFRWRFIDACAGNVGASPSPDFSQ